MSLGSQAGFLIIKREPESIWRHLPESERSPIIRYRGFDGRDKWPLDQTGDAIILECEMAPVRQLRSVLDYYARARREHGDLVDLLLLAGGGQAIQAEGFAFIGFDAGLLAEDEVPVYFSVVLNEVRTQGNAALRNLATKLNEWYLFAREEDARECLEVRRKSIESGTVDFLETAYRAMNDVVGIHLYIGNAVHGII